MSPLLSLLALTASPVFVQSVQGQSDAGRYVLHIRGEAALEPQQISGRVEGRRLTVYVQGGRAHSENRAWGEGEGHVRAFRHRERLELEARLPAADCKSSVNVAAGIKGSVTVSVICPALIASGSAMNATQPLALEAEKDAAAQTGLLAAVALLPTSELPAANKPASAPALPVAAKVPVDAKLIASPAAASARPLPQVAPDAVAKVQPAAARPTPDLVPAKAAKQPEPHAGAAAASPASLWTVALRALTPVLAIAALALVGLKFSRKRRLLGRHVRILETTPLGPKRSLIVATVGNETLLLGASEAGIALIQVRPTEARGEDGIDAFTPPVAKQKDDPETLWVDTLKHVKADKEESAAEAGQVKLLARLFSKRRQEIPEAWPFANILDASMLEDSLEDRELREKLASGMEARIP